MSTNDPSTLFSLAKDNSTSAVLHLRFQGRSRDIALDTLAMNAGSPDDDVKRAVAQFIDVAVADLNNMVIERHSNGNLTLRPEAVFG
ncbi:MAG: hypothetical protein HYX67_11380 [Candidatus Melainabacteria bacterium]|nr:hypothetical protein [Candidatus Melainabacteria bacterium]